MAWPRSRPTPRRVLAAGAARRTAGRSGTKLRPSRLTPHGPPGPADPARLAAPWTTRTPLSLGVGPTATCRTPSALASSLSATPRTRSRPRALTRPTTSPRSRPAPKASSTSAAGRPKAPGSGPTFLLGTEPRQHPLQEESELRADPQLWISPQRRMRYIARRTHAGILGVFGRSDNGGVPRAVQARSGPFRLRGRDAVAVVRAPAGDCGTALRHPGVVGPTIRPATRPLPMPW